MYKKQSTATVIDSLLITVSMYPNWNWYMIRRTN
jgi:hypothetical protein